MRSSTRVDSTVPTAKLKDVTTPALPSPTARPRPVVMCGDRSELDIVLGAIEARGWTDEYGDIPEGDVEEDEEGADCRNVEWWRQRFASERAWQQRWVARCCAIALGTMTPPPAAEDDDVRFIRQCHLVGQDALRRLPHEEGAIWRHIDRQYWRLTNISVPSLANKLAMRDAELQLRHGQIRPSPPTRSPAAPWGPTRSCRRSNLQRYRPF